MTVSVPPSIFAAGAIASPSPAQSGNSATNSSWSQKWNEWTSGMDQIFHDSIDAFHSGNSSANSAFDSSINVQDKGDAYVARIYVPKSDEGNAKVTLDNGVLKIVTGDPKTGGYEENINLSGPVQQDKMKVEHKEGVLVVTIPKSAGNTAATARTQDQTATSNEAWDQNIRREMQRMEDRMDQLSRDVFADMPNLVNLPAVQMLNSTVKVDNDKDQYVVHFYLPDQNAANFKVNLNDQNELVLSASTESKNQKTDANATSSQYAEGSYEEAITLPGPVHADRMKVDRNNDVVTVTLPKA